MEESAEGVASSSLANSDLQSQDSTDTRVCPEGSPVDDADGQRGASPSPNSSKVVIASLHLLYMCTFSSNYSIAWWCFYLKDVFFASSVAVGTKSRLFREDWPCLCDSNHCIP